MCAHRALQESNRLTHYTALWNSFKALGLELPPSPETYENVVFMENGLRCFGARKLIRDKLNGVDPIMRSEDGSIVALKEGEDSGWIKALARNGWRANYQGMGPPTEIIAQALANGAAVLNVFGAFDDYNVTAALIGSDTVLDTLLQ